MKRTILIFASISGAISAAMIVLFGLTQKGGDFKNSEILGYATILLSMSFVFFGIKSYRDNQLNGSITFSKAFQVGILITIVSCLIYVIAWMVVYHTMIPDFMDMYSQAMIKKAQASGASQQEINDVTAQMNHFKEMYKNPLLMAGLTFLEPFPIGLLVTLVAALILRRKQIVPDTIV
jgi:hypothetical protein